MRIQLNGAESRVPVNMTLAALLRASGIDTSSGNGVAIAVNGAVVLRAEWESLHLQAEDAVEIVRAVQGG